MLLAAACGALTVAAKAQSLEVGVHGGAIRLDNSTIGSVPTSIVEPFNYQPISLRDGFRVGFRITLNSQIYTGHELGYAYNRTALRYYNDPTSDQGMAIHQGFYNFLGYLTKDTKPVRPFATVGAHFNNYVPPGASVTSGGGSTKFGFNYGAGVKVKVSSKYGVRFDVRQYQNTKPFDLPNRTGLLKMTEISAGFSLII